MGKLSFEAHLRYVLATDIAGFLLGLLLLFLVSRIRSLISPLAFVLLLIALAAGFALDVILWVVRGVRSVELDDDALTLYRGASMTPQRIGRSSVQRIRIVQRMGRRTVVMQLGGLRRARVNEEAFPRESFGRLITALRDWGSDPSRN